MNLCKDCKHLRRDVPLFWLLRFAKCTNVSTGRNPVDGKVQRNYAELERKYGQCGPEGTLFERK